MIKRSNLFLVNTEYQLLLSLSVILKSFQDPAIFRNKVIINNSVKNCRIQIPTKDSEINAEFVFISTNYEFYKKNFELKKILKTIAQEKYDNFISFFEHNPVHYFLAYRLSNAGTKIGLGQDGMKAYSRIKRFTFFAQIKATIRLYRFLIVNDLFIPHFALINYRFGYHSLTNELYLTHPETYDNWSKKRLNKINTKFNETELQLIKQIFDFTNSEIIVFEDSIFYLNQPVKSLEEAELELLKALNEIFPQRQIIVKVHPLTSKFHKSKLIEQKNVCVFKSPVPAELFISEFKNSIILSGWSTALLFENDTCNYYWLYPYFKNRNPEISDRQINNPTNHIQMIENLKDIYFPTSKEKK